MEEIDVTVDSMEWDFAHGVAALQRATESADAAGHDEAVFYLKAALAGIAAARALIANQGEDGQR